MGGGGMVVLPVVGVHADEVAGGQIELDGGHLGVAHLGAGLLGQTQGARHVAEGEGLRVRRKKDDIRINTGHKRTC